MMKMEENRNPPRFGSPSVSCFFVLGGILTHFLLWKIPDKRSPVSPCGKSSCSGRVSARVGESKT